jgi:hypothetical protein
MINPLKKKVLSNLIDVLDQEDGKMLMKHPKIMAAKITVAKPLDKKEAMKEEEKMRGPMFGKEAELEDEMENEMEDESEGLLDNIEDLSEIGSLPDDVKEKLIKMLSK